MLFKFKDDLNLEEAANKKTKITKDSEVIVEKNKRKYKDFVQEVMSQRDNKQRKLPTR